MEDDKKQDDLLLNQQGGVDGCAIATLGLVTFFVGLGLLIFGMYLESVFFMILGLFLGTLVAGFLILYPIIRILFGGKDSVAAAVATAYVEGVITHKIAKNARKKRTRY